MNYKVTGVIQVISEAEELSSGAKKLTYRIDTQEPYSNIWEFEVYKNKEYAEHVDNFIKYNKVGDKVEVEFNVRPRIWEKENRVFTSLSHWKLTKVGEGAVAVAVEEEVGNDLPF